MLSFLRYKTVMNCEYQLDKMTVRFQWARTIADIITCAFYYINCSLLNLFLLFRPFQLKGVKSKLILVSCVIYFLDALYRGGLQAVGKPFFILPTLYKLPVFILIFASFCSQPYIIASIC